MIVDESFRALGSTVRVIAGGPAAPAAVARVRAEIRAAHARLTRFDPGSELSRLNADPRGTVPCSSVLRDAVRAALAAARRSGGLVDPALLDALEAAGYDRSLAGERPPLRPAGAPRTAAPARAARWRSVRVDDAAGTVSRPPGLRLDLGGTAKGHLADRAARHLAGTADWVLDCGGDVRLGSAREVVVAHPTTPAPAARLRIGPGAVATSAVTARAWAGGYAHHLLDPATGAPVRTGLLSATAVADTALDAETLAKMALLGGPRAARALLSAAGGVLVHEDDEVEVLTP